MNKRTTFLIFGLTLLFNQAIGQTFKEQFNDLVSKKDTLGQQQLLDKWEKADSNNPELYVAYFNYFVKKSKKEIVRLDNNPKGKEGFQIMDKDSSKKEPVAFMYGDTYYDSDLLKKGFDYIDKGIEKHPNRLDMCTYPQLTGIKLKNSLTVFTNIIFNHLIRHQIIKFSPAYEIVKVKVHF